MNYLLKGGRVIDPSRKLAAGPMDILVEGGRIARLEENISQISVAGRRVKGGDLEVLDLKGMVVSPGLVDMHTHLREPGLEYKETIRSGSEAALAGGFTSLACMPNTTPVNDNRAVTEFITRKSLECGLVRIYPIAAITKESEGKQLSEFGDLKDAGAIALSDDGRPVMDAGIMRRALEYAASFGMPVISHCEDLRLSAGGMMNEGLAATRLGLAGIPGIAEDVMVSRDIILADFTKTAVHIAHVSTKEAVALVRDAKKRGVKVTAETAPHYFSLTDEFLSEYDTNGKVNPPLRTQDDVQAIKEGLRDGTIDVIASDHAPHGRTDKEVEFDYAAFGISGLETSLALGLRLVEEGILTLRQLIARMASVPAKILQIPGGTLEVGSAADLTVIDVGKVWRVAPLAFRSRGRNTPFAGWELRGKAVLTMVGGEIRYREGAI
ncbi:MAG: dihydroorotase, partial [Deltaproteobacteria bacterium]|nr:dihydroorotase [Deltaproteobacteria bacterium]